MRRLWNWLTTPVMVQARITLVVLAALYVYFAIRSKPLPIDLAADRERMTRNERINAEADIMMRRWKIRRR